MGTMLSFLFGAGGWGRNLLYDMEFFRSKKLSGTVVSIGNLSVGGAGKTPFVICLGELLRDHGIRFDVLSRGYGRRTRGVAVVDPAGTAAQYGDEPILIAQRLGVPVIVGESRYKAGLRAEQRFGPQLHLLDDGFQHRELARSFDIVMLNDDDFEDHLLPWGRLREPLSSLKRADVVVVNEKSVIDREARGKPIWRIRRGLELQSAPTRPVVFSGIARPKLFLEQLQELGVEPAGEIIFRDHQTYGDEEIRRLLDAKSIDMADGFITTEKDALNLGTRMCELGEVAMARVTMELLNPEQALQMMLEKLQQQLSRSGQMRP